MQGIVFRKYIRGQFFDLPLFAYDLAKSMTDDGDRSVTSEQIQECFDTAQLIGWAEDEVKHPLNTAAGCFALYCHALGLIGTRLTDVPPGQGYSDDVWADMPQWRSTSAVLEHLNRQVMNAMLSTEGVEPPFMSQAQSDHEHRSDWQKVHRFIDEALDKRPAPVTRIH